MIHVQLDCSAWQGYIAAALEASPSTPITPSLPQLTALLGPRTAEEEGEYAREASELAEQIFISECMTEEKNPMLDKFSMRTIVCKVFMNNVCQQHHQEMRLTDAQQHVLQFAMAAKICYYTCTDA